MLPRLLVTELLNNSETILNVEHYRNVLWSIQWFRVLELTASDKSLFLLTLIL